MRKYLPLTARPFSARPFAGRLVGFGLAAALLTSAPALAWIPKLDDSTAKNVIDAAYGRRDALPTYLTADLGVQDGKFRSGTVKAFDGGDACVSDWLAAPTAYDKSGSRLGSLTLSGQADQLSFQAGAARDSFKNLTAADALKDSASRLPDGQIRLDLVVTGLADLKQRAAYLVRLKGPDGKLLAPVKSSYVNDWKPMNPANAPVAATASTTATTTTNGNTTTATTTVQAVQPQGPFTGTLVYYFEPTKVGINANDKVDILVRTEAESGCAYAVNFDLGQFY